MYRRRLHFSHFSINRLWLSFSSQVVVVLLGWPAADGGDVDPLPADGDWMNEPSIMLRVNDGSSSFIEADAEPTLEDEVDDEPAMYSCSDVFRFGIGMLLRLDGGLVSISIMPEGRRFLAVRAFVHAAVVPFVPTCREGD